MMMKTLVIVLLLAAAAASVRLAPLVTHEERIPGRYIVKLKAGRDVDASIASLGGAKVFHKYKKLFPGFAAQLTDSMVNLLRASDAVEYIEEDGLVQANSVASWGLDRIDQINLPLDDVYQPIGNGNGIDVYVIDSGINFNHIDFAGRVEFGYDLFGYDGTDCNGHGSHCAGTVAGTNYGVAKAANLIAVRVLDCLGSSSTSGVIAGCDWVIYSADGPSVVSMSLGTFTSQAMDDGVQGMIDAGITVVVAAGNDGDDACYVSPARLPDAITVGATDNTDTCTIFSNYGPCVDIFAPGFDITSAAFYSSDATSVKSGTSMAAPHVAGAAAILLGNDVTLTPAEISSILLEKAISGAVSDTGPESPDLLLYIGEGNGEGYVPFRNFSGCGGYFSEPSGSFASPNYPGNYLSDQSCSYLFSGEQGKPVTVEFLDFELEPSTNCIFDDVSIYDGATNSSALIGKWCGSGVDAPELVTSTGSDMLIVFTSDYAYNFRGFNATYLVGQPPRYPETGDCGHVFTWETGKLTSPGFPDTDYRNYEDCPFTIQGSVGQTVTLTFEFLDVEPILKCRYDSVKVYDGVDASGTLLANLCGTEPPIRAFKTSGSSMFVHFVTDKSSTYRGFSASYVIQ